MEGLPARTQVIMERIYKYAFQFFKMGYIGPLWVLFVIILIITAIQWRLQKGWVFYDG